MTVLEVIAAIILPPLAAFMEVGFTKHFWINVLLTVLLPWLGGFIHALWLIFSDAGRPQHA